MLRTAFFCGLFFFAAVCLAHDPNDASPEAHYHPKPSDPEWLKYAARFHGHLGPAIVAGGRLGLAGVRAVGAQGYFDVEVDCEGPFERPPQSCFIDGVQLGTGATLGKRTIHCSNAKDVMVRVRNTKTGKTVEVRPSDKLMEMLAWTSAEDDAKLKAKNAKNRTSAEIEELARTVFAMPDKELLTVEEVEK